VKFMLISEGAPDVKQQEITATSPVPTLSISKRFVTAAEVLHARRTGANLNVGYASGMTPLARDLARRYGVVLTTDNDGAC
jgi:hypothetical protein